jgi:hypothetical protein
MELVQILPVSRIKAIKFHTNDELDGGDVLPGFKLTLSDIFKV